MKTRSIVLPFHRLVLVLVAALTLSSWGAAPPEARAQGTPGAVYVMTNQAGGNAIVTYHRGADGTLTAGSPAPTGGLGTGGGLGSQGALVLSDNGQWLFAVNAGSDDVSVFRVQSNGLVLTDRESSGGSMPTSVTYANSTVYVLNAGGSGNISGFTLSPGGTLTPLAGSTRPLSNHGVGTAPAPAQVAFTPDGGTLLVTERATSLLLTYAVDKDGVARGPVSHPSSGTTPFGFAFADRTTVVVSKAFGGAVNPSAASSYRVAGGAVSLSSGSVPTGQTAACWVVVTKNGKYAYTTNAGSASISAYAISSAGRLTLLAGVAGTTSAGPSDAALSANGQFLYALSASNGMVTGFAVQADGTLTSLGAVGGLPAGAVGVAAR